MGYPLLRRLGRLAMRGSGSTFAAAALAAGVGLAGCGGSSSTPSSSSAASNAQSPPSRTTSTGTTGTGTASNPSEAVPTTTIDASIPGLLKEGYFPKRYTCDGADISIPLRWSNVPAGTAELAMFLINLKPVNGKLFFDWALANVSPALHALSAGAVPGGVLLGRNSFGNVGYSICPPRGTVEEHFILRLVALAHPLDAKPGFDAETVYREAERSEKVVGLAGGVYTRR
jgi:phosphatidylethanolamine-binding protein (PEBP) family uncharacterized protein